MKSRRHLKDPEHSFFTQRHAADMGNRTKIQRASDTFLSVARCPLCRVPLSLLMGRRGPYFHCGCRRPAENGHAAPGTEVRRGA
jgi:hypothetical protein